MFSLYPIIFFNISSPYSVAPSYKNKGLEIKLHACFTLALVEG